MSSLDGMISMVISMWKFLDTLLINTTSFFTQIMFPKLPTHIVLESSFSI